MRNVTIKGLLAHKLRLALTALAIVLGVTFISGTFVLTDTLHNTFTVLFGNIYHKIDFQVRGVAQLGSGANATRNPLPESLLATVRVCPVSRPPRARSGATPSSWPTTARRSRPAARRPSASDFDPDQQISALHLVAGGPPVTADDVVMDAGTAQKYDFTVGQQVRILSAGPPRTFTITGIAQFGTANNLAGATLAAFTLPTAQAVVQEAGQARRHQRGDRPGRQQGRGPAGHRQGPAARGGGGHRADRGEREHELGQPGAVVLLHRAAGLRVHLAVRRRVHHLQHVLDHRRAADPGAGPAADRRRQPPPGVPLGARPRRPSLGSSPR